jgi:hypothetical protein
VLFPQHFLVALYGHPGTAGLGVLGEQDVDAAVQRGPRHRRAVRGAGAGRRVVPAFEIIATVASEFPTEEGDYSYEAPVETLRPWVDAAGARRPVRVLDLQPGRTDFVTQAERYRPCWSCPTSAWRWTRSGG